MASAAAATCTASERIRSPLGLSGTSNLPLSNGRERAAARLEEIRSSLPGRLKFFLTYRRLESQQAFRSAVKQNRIPRPHGQTAVRERNAVRFQFINSVVSVCISMLRLRGTRGWQWRSRLSRRARWDGSRRRSARGSRWLPPTSRSPPPSRTRFPRPRRQDRPF